MKSYLSLSKRTMLLHFFSKFRQELAPQEKWNRLPACKIIENKKMQKHRKEY
jgi:hypothetical protein